jgi:hypothetical protein
VDRWKSERLLEEVSFKALTKALEMEKLATSTHNEPGFDVTQHHVMPPRFVQFS